MDNLKKAGGNVEGFVTTDNVAVGAKGASFIIDKLGAEGGEVAIIEGKAGNASGEARRNGATEAFKKASQIKLVASQPADWDRIKALDVATNVLQRNPNVKAIYCANDTMAMGVAQAVANAGKTGKVLVVGLSLFGEPFQPQRIYQVGEVLSPSEWTGFVYVCEQPGTAGSQEPVWPQAEDAAVQVGSAVFRTRQYLPIVAHGPLQPEIEVS